MTGLHNTSGLRVEEGEGMDGDKVRFRVTVTGEYEGTPGCDGYDGETDPKRMAAIDAENDWYALLEAVEGLTMKVEPVAAHGGGDGVESLLARVHDRLGAGVHLTTHPKGVDVLWRRDYGDAGLSDPRSMQQRGLLTALQAVLDYEDEADRIDAEEAPSA